MDGWKNDPFRFGKVTFSAVNSLLNFRIELRIVAWKSKIFLKQTVTLETWTCYVMWLLDPFYHKISSP